MTTEQPRPLLPTVPGSFILINGELQPNPPQLDPGVREWLAENGYFDAPPPPKASKPEIEPTTTSKPEIEPTTTLNDVVDFLRIFGLDDELEKHLETREDIVDFAGNREWSEQAECFCFVYEDVIVWTEERVYFLIRDWEDWFLVSGPRNPEAS